MDPSHLESVANKASKDLSIKIIVGAATAGLAMLGVASVMIVVGVYVRRRRRKYERIPLIRDK